MLPMLCEELGLPSPAADGSKRERMTASFDALADTELPKVARKLLMRHPPNAATRNQIQDILWNGSAYPPIPKRHRREVARRLNSEEPARGGQGPAEEPHLRRLARRSGLHRRLWLTYAKRAAYDAAMASLTKSVYLRRGRPSMACRRSAVPSAPCMTNF